MYCDGIGTIHGSRIPGDPDYFTPFGEKIFKWWVFLVLPNPRNSSNLKTALKLSGDLQKCDFIDANTRVVILEFALVNPSMLDVFTLFYFSVEFDVTGAVYQDPRIHQYRLFRRPQTIKAETH